MPVVRIEYDDVIVSEADARAVCEAAQKVISESTGIADVFVYGNSSQIKVNVAPIEIWVEVSDSKISDADVLTKELREKLNNWKVKTNFSHPLNLTLIPMHWKVEIGI